MEAFDPSDPYLDWEESIEITQGDLPHWHQDGKIQYITFRLIDSIPLSRQRELTAVADRFHRNYPEPWDELTLRRYRSLMGHVSETQLHSGLGSCVLRRPELRQLLADTLHYRDGREYQLLAYVIMPNHCHLVIHTAHEKDTSDIIQSVKRYSSTRINRALGRTGRLWQREEFDRLVRSRTHLDHCIRYIRHNPANLPPTDFTLYVSPSWTDY